MSGYLEQWAEGITRRSFIKIKKACAVEGLCDRHVGPRCDFGKIAVDVTPAESLAISITVESPSDQSKLFAEEAVMGILDVLVTAKDAPVLGLNIKVASINCNEVDSKPIAFRLAGRDAGRKILESALS